ncbi:single-stranded DNA-binding protein [Streptomyces apricus]|uniref:Single-stranded DNA-binding protein n=1 Tax=Streptomyces apricus TaxID=1828112 RepID=A0A5B0AQW3_9ACTN|nr:single-stranded DNA-binding protein [Streptomyces apricus]KAA0932290.1 single-stranded DNA-binding protein [Streptomyces apricus]
MNETTVCVVGNVATRPVFRETAAGASARFRLAVTQRYWDREKSAWRDGHTNFFTVWANRTLATNVQASVSVGEPLVVRGRLKIRSEQRDGQSWAGADIEASAIGHDLARGTAAFRRALRSEQTPDRMADQDSGQGAARQGPGPVSGHAAGHASGLSPDPAARPEPDWETGPVEGPGERREPVLAS